MPHGPGNLVFGHELRETPADHLLGLEQVQLLDGGREVRDRAFGVGHEDRVEAPFRDPAELLFALLEGVFGLLAFGEVLEQAR